MKFKDFRELFYTTDDKAKIVLYEVYNGNGVDIAPLENDVFRVIDARLNLYDEFNVIGLVDSYRGIGVVLSALESEDN